MTIVSTPLKQPFIYAFALCCVLLGSGPPLHAFGGSDADKPVYTVDVRRGATPLGSFSIELFPGIAPKAVHYFDSLVTIHFFDSTAFHRVIPGFMIQGGDPNSRHGDRSTWGYGDPEQRSVDAEFSPVAYVRGILGAARDSDPNSATSQFFICVANALHLNNNYTVYGGAVSGMNIVDSIVRAPRDASDNPLVKLSMFVTRSGVNDSIPEAPTLLLPQDNAENVASTTSFSWSRPTSVVLYEIEISEDSVFQNIVVRDTVGIYANSSTGPELLNLGGFNKPFHRYYWRVRAHNGGHSGPYSLARSFVTQIAAPSYISPDSGALNIPLTSAFRWTSVAGAERYHLRVSTSPLFLASKTPVNDSFIVDTRREVQGLSPNTKYYWKIGAFHGALESQASDIWFFTTTGTDGVADENENLFTNAYPQPSSRHLSIRAEEGVCARVIDMHGNPLKTARFEYLSGEGLLQVDLIDCAAGRYTLELVGSRGRRCVAVIVQP